MSVEINKYSCVCLAKPLKNTHCWHVNTVKQWSAVFCLFQILYRDFHYTGSHLFVFNVSHKTGRLVLFVIIDTKNKSNLLHAVYNLMLRHSVSYLSPNCSRHCVLSGGTQRRAFDLVPERRNKNRTHNRRVTVTPLSLCVMTATFIDTKLNILILELKPATGYLVLAKWNC